MKTSRYHCRRPSDAPQRAKDEPRDFDHAHDSDDYEDEYDEEDYYSDEDDDDERPNDTTTRMGTIMGKIMGDAYGDNQFDFYDFIPLLVVLVGSAVLVAGLFPTGFRKVGCHEFRQLS